MIRKIIALSAFTAALALGAQNIHTVVKGDNAYNISKKYGISTAELYRMNPKVQDGKISIGEVLVVGKSAGSKPAAQSAELGKIIIQPKQTIYGLTKQYKISEADLRALNPNLDSNMKIGSEVTLPLAAISSYGGNQVIAAQNSSVETPAVAEKTVNSDANDTYMVQPKDNYYKLTRKFSLTQKELFAMNPGLEEKGLRPGETIIVQGNTSSPAPAKSATEKIETDTPAPNTYTTTSTADDYVTYTVQSGDTVFGILNKFGIGLDELLTLNPNLSSGLKAGMVLKIKKLDAGYVKKSGDALNVVIMLPFGFDTNDSKFRTLSLDFLSGAKLAIERSAASGQKLDVKIIDAGNEASFKNSLTQINSDNTDLIIGPFFKSNVLQVLDYVKTQKIPVVAPFANSDDLLKFENLILIETNQSVFADRIVKEVKDVYSDQKIYIVADDDKSNANYLKTNLEKTLKNANVVIVNSGAEIEPDKNMMTGQSAPVIAILASDRDADGDAFANRMMALSKEISGIKAFSMYYSPIFERKVDELSQVNLVYLMDRKVDSEGRFEKEILEAYKSKYCKTPPKYSIIGFDIVNDMLSRENKKGEIFKQMNKVQTQLATKFEFEKTRNGAYVNKGYRVVRLLPN